MSTVTPRWTTRWWTRRGAAVLAVAALAVGVVLVVRPARSVQDAPAGVVRHYFAALESGDAASALSFGPVPAGARGLVSDAALRAQQHAAGIRGLEIVSTRITGAQAVVEAGYQVAFPDGPTSATADIDLVRRGATWSLAASAVATRFAFTGGAERASIDGVRVPTGTALVFPGVVAVRFDSPYLSGTVGNGVITFGAPAVTDVQVGVTAAGRAVMRSATRRALRSCLLHGGTTCPQPDERVVPGTLRGRLSGAVRNERVGLAHGPLGVLTLSATASAVVRYRQLDFTNGTRSAHGPVRLAVHAEAVATRGLGAASIRWAS